MKVYFNTNRKQWLRNGTLDSEWSECFVCCIVAITSIRGLRSFWTVHPVQVVSTAILLQFCSTFVL